jgi:hypothetical protein
MAHEWHMTQHAERPSPENVLAEEMRGGGDWHSIQVARVPHAAGGMRHAAVRFIKPHAQRAYW